MTTEFSTIAERALRRLNFAVVPLDDRPRLTELVPAATIATMALVELGVIASDETPIPSDQALVLDKVASVHAALDAQGMVWWTGAAIPRAFVEEYVKLVAAQASSKFRQGVRPGGAGVARRSHPPGRDGHRLARHRGRGGDGGSHRSGGAWHRALVESGHPRHGGAAVRDAGR